MEHWLVVQQQGNPHGHAQQLLWAARTQPVQLNTQTTSLACILTTVPLSLLHHLHPSQGGIFSLKLQFTEHYPAKPPRVRFTCEMFHPNVRPLPPAAACRTGYRLRQLEQGTCAPSRQLHADLLLCWLFLFACQPQVYADGNICMDTLQDKWSPCHNVNSVLMSIQSMLTDPNCSSPANPEAAQLFIKDKAAYNRWGSGAFGLLAPSTTDRMRSQRQLDQSRLVLAARLCFLSVLLDSAGPAFAVSCGSAGGCGALQQRASRVASSCQPQYPAAAGAWAAQAQQQRHCKQCADAPALSAASNRTGCCTVASRGVCSRVFGWWCGL